MNLYLQQHAVLPHAAQCNKETRALQVCREFKQVNDGNRPVRTSSYLGCLADLHRSTAGWPGSESMALWNMAVIP